MSKNLILIDNRVQDYETIVAAVDPALAVSVVFDYFEDTFDTLKERIGALGTNTSGVVSVGLIQHNYKAPMFSMMASAELAPVAQVAAQDPGLERWVQFRDFITWCKTEFNTAHFDMMACALYSDPDWKYVIDTLTAQTGVTVRASTDDTGAAALGGDWFLESHTGMNLKTVYFTEAIEEYRGILYLYTSDIREYSTKGFATGSVQAWGVITYSSSGTTPSSVTATDSGVVSIYSTSNGFAALKTDGSVVQWGGGGITAPSSVTAANSGVISIYSTDMAFAALKNNGSVVAWEEARYGGTAPSSVTAANSNVVAVYSTSSAFAALKTDGSVVAWGEASYGGTIFYPQGSFLATPIAVTAANSGVVAIYSNYYAFAALKSNGSVVAWGFADRGGTTPGNVSSGVVAVYSTNGAFTALKTDGSVVAWGGYTAPSSVTAANSGVVAVYSNDGAFAALKTDGSIVVWGSYANTTPSSVTAANSGVVTVYSAYYAFAALKTDGSVVAWGSSDYGGTAPTTVTAANSGVVSIYSTYYAFAALKTDGSVVAWGSSTHGGTAPSSVTDANSGVVAVYSTNTAFAALKSDGSVVAWGLEGGTNHFPGISSGVVSIYSTFGSFTALKTTATTFDLSGSYYSNMDRYNILRKKENRRRVNLTTLNNNVFTLSAARDIQSFNRTIPSGESLRIIVPDYVSSPHSITSTATIPSGAGSVIIACDEGEPVTISGTTYVNYGSYVYKRETNNTYTKLTTEQTISGTSYTMYGGDGINSSGIALVEPPKPIPVLSTFAVASSKTFGDASFAIITRPTSDSSGAITYSSSNPDVASIDASGNWITLVAAGDVSFNAAQAATADYAAATKASNTLTVSLGTSTLSSSTFSVAASKTYGDASFAIITRPTSDSSGAITYSSSNPDVASIDASGNWITLVAAGDVSFNATQAATPQYASAAKASNTLTVSLGTSTLSSSTFAVAASKTFGDASFAIITRPTSDSSGAITYSSSNPDVASIDASGNFITLVGAGDVSFNATQAQTAQYLAATKASNTLTVSKAAAPTLSFVSPPTTKNLTDAAFTVVASSASSGAVTYTSSNTAFATVGASSGLVTLKGVGTVTITAAQAESAQYNAPANTTCSIMISAAGSELAGQTVSPGTSFAGLNLSGASLVGTTLSGVSFSGATLTNANFSGATITGTDFTNANISGATNLPAFSTAQKLQLLSNINNVAISEIQINTQLSGADINAILPTPIPAITSATFTLKVPTTLDASLNKVLTITSVDLSNNASVYIPLNANESVSINGTVFSFNGTNILDAGNNPRTYVTIVGIPFKIYAGSVIALNILNALNNVMFGANGMYNILSELFVAQFLPN
jgi:alpha-tubulin suppressor-like RCC1 family protein